MTDDAPVAPTDAWSAELVLFQRTQQGDRAALRELYHRHRSPVYWAAYAVLHSRPDAEEVLQDTFLTMWNKRGRISIVGESTLPWLVTTARYLALNKSRAQRRRASDSLETSKEPIDERPTAEDQAINEEAMTIIRDSISRTSLLDQRIFQLCLVEDLSYKQAAHQLGVSHSSVRNRLSRLRMRLRIELDTLKGDDER